MYVTAIKTKAVSISGLEIMAGHWTMTVIASVDMYCRLKTKDSDVFSDLYSDVF